MIFNTGAALLDAIVLAVVSWTTDGTYGYKITKEVQQLIDVSESTLYPVLRRLSENDFVVIYDQQYQGRNRKYYKITEKGRQQQMMLAQEWKAHTAAINEIIENSGVNVGGENE